MSGVGELRPRHGRVGQAYTVSLRGLDGEPILVEAVTMSGLPSTSIVGLPDAAVGEAKERLRAGFLSIGVPWPHTRLTLNLSPADVHKAGSGFDLALAAAVLTSLGARGISAHTAVLGEIGLGGDVRPIRGVISAVVSAQESGFTEVIVPRANAAQARLVPGIEIIGIGHLSELAALVGVEGFKITAGYEDLKIEADTPVNGDLSDVRGQDTAIHGLMVAAAGGHHALMVGSPGVGKTMLATRLPAILPPLQQDEAVEVAAVRSLDGEEFSVLPRMRPLVAPHHTTTVAALVGGGSGLARPGAITKAHRGVLFLDEFAEFSVRTIQALRQPMESGSVELRRVHGTVFYPAQFQLLAAANPCQCGRLLDGPGQCTCTSRERRVYQDKLGGPVKDRIDITLALPRPTKADLKAQGGMRSADISELVLAARMRQQRRFAQDPSAYERRADRLIMASGLNAILTGRWLRANTPLDDVLTAHFDTEVARGNLSMRAIDRILRLSWTLADLDGADVPQSTHLYQAISLREGA